MYYISIEGLDGFIPIQNKNAVIFLYEEFTKAGKIVNMYKESKSGCYCLEVSDNITVSVNIVRAVMDLSE